MIRRLIIIIAIQCILFPALIHAEEAVSKRQLDLSNLKNPFQSTLPPPAPKPEPVKVVVKDLPKPVVKEIVKPVVKKTPPSLKLNGMVWGEAKHHAIINNQIVTEGNLIEGAQVISITRKGVQLSFEKDTMFIAVDK